MTAHWQQGAWVSSSDGVGGQDSQRSTPTSLIVKPLAQEGVACYRWSLGSSACAQARVGEGSLEQLAAELAAFCSGQENARELLTVWLVVPAALVCMKSMSANAGELKHLSRLAPFELEDDIACEVESLHVVCSPVSDHSVTVMALESQWLSDQYEALCSLGLQVSHCVPESLLLPWSDHEWTLWFDEELVVRSGQYEGFALASALISDALALVENTPQSLSLWAPTQEQLDQLIEKLPPSWRGLIRHQQCADQWPAAVGVGNNTHASMARAGAPFDFSVGRFARRLPLARWWLQWRALVGVGAAVFIGWLLLGSLTIYQHNAQQAQLQSAIESAYRQVMPQGVLVDPVKQLQNQRAQHGGTVQPSQAVSMLARVIPLVANSDGILLKSVTYHDVRRELRLSIDAKSFKQIEHFRAAIAEQGLTAQLVSANMNDGTDALARHQARLKIGWQ